MPGLEYRYNAASGDNGIVANEYELDSTYTTAAPGDAVKLNASGKVVKAAASEAKLLGVLVAKTLKRATESPAFCKVCVIPTAVFEIAVTGGTPIVGTAYEITATGTMDVTKTTTPCLTVEKLVPGNATAMVRITGRQIG